MLAGCYPDCPDREDVNIVYNVATDIGEPGETVVFDSEVTVTDVTVRGSQLTIDVSGPDLEGIERDLTLDIEVTPGLELPFEAGESLRMQYVHDEPLWTNTFIGFWRDDTLLLSLIDQAIIVKGSLWVDPLRLKVKRGYCAQKSDDCGAHERAGIRVQHPDGQSEVVMDHGTGTLLGTPTYRILIERAIINYDSLFVPCPNREHGRLRGVIVHIPG